MNRKALMILAGFASLAGVFSAAASSDLEQSDIAAIKADRRAFAATQLGEALPPLRRRYFVPNDPYFGNNSPAGFLGQWHLDNNTGGGPDANLLPAWAKGYTGNGVVIGIVDDGLQAAHPDLSPNYLSNLSYDFGQSDGNPSPVFADDNHGTSVAGVAAARGGNGLGVTGAAPQANLAGLRIDFENQTTQMFVDATLHQSTGNNPSIDIKNHSYGIGVPFVESSSEVNALATSTSAGTIHVVAAGNERQGDVDEDGDVAKKALQNSRHAITVAALGISGFHASYSNYGGNVFVTAPSSDNGTGITTTDRTGNPGYNESGTADGELFPDTSYTDTFGGTSSATPLVAGVLALAKEVNPALDTRWAKQLLAQTSVKVDLFDNSDIGGWVTNAAGFDFNPSYGFGLIDADALTEAASQTTGYRDGGSESTSQAVNRILADEASLTEFFTLTTDDKLEQLEIELDLTHEYRGDLEAYLTSPSGTTSRLMLANIGDFEADLDWSFTTNAFWGESAAGQWTLSVTDQFEFDTGTWNSFGVSAYFGEASFIPEPTGIALLILGVFGIWGCEQKHHG